MGTAYKGTKEEVTALNSFIKFARAYNSVSARISRVFAAEKLTESQFGVLEAIYHLGPMPQKKLAEKLLKSGGNITMVIDNLAKRGLVFRKKTKEDRRYYWIYLTREGEKLIEKIFPAHVRLITDRLAILNEQEQLQFAQLCKKLGKYQEENKK